VRLSVQPAGVVPSCGWKGAAEVESAKREATLRSGARAMLSRASKVLVGEAVETGVAAVSRLPQVAASPAVPPEVLMQAARMSARVLI
jgi:hypothetical protein